MKAKQLKISSEMRQLAEAESKTTQGEWVVREMGNDFFVERPRQHGEAYGIEVMSDDAYATKRADAVFIVTAKRIAMAIRAATESEVVAVSGKLKP